MISVAVSRVELEGMPITFGRVTTHDATFDPKAAENRSRVLIKVRVFSCNYRDKGLILAFGRICKPNTYCFIGSEFVGEVVAVGSEVAAFRPGDRAMGINPWPSSEVEGVLPGIPTNHASHRYHAGHVGQVMKVPEIMPDAVAAGFSIGAQTIYSIIRKLNPKPGANILVTAARSNTSLFALHALKQHQVSLYALTTSRGFESRLREIGVQHVIELESDLASFKDNQQIKDLVACLGGFDYVIDPFYDLHLGKLIDVMASGATYVTCGLADQYSQVIGRPFKHAGTGLDQVMGPVCAKNIHLMGDCLGETADLAQALQDSTSGTLPVIIDSVFTGDRVGDFISRTYCAADRFGKVIYQYD